MAIIICNECGKEISDSAKTCPHCGCETVFGKREKKSKEISVVFLLAIGAICIGFFLFVPACLTIFTNMNDWYFWNWYKQQADEAIRNLIIGSVLLATGGAYIGILIKSKSTGNTVFVDDETRVYDSGTIDEYCVRVYVSNLVIRTGPGTQYAKTGEYTGTGEFMIVAESYGSGSEKGWGKLKNGKGWISLDYVEKI